MAAKAGRKVLVYYTPPNETEEIAFPALKAKSISLNKEVIDITTDDSSGWRELLSDAGTRSVDVELEGLLISRTQLERWDNEEFLTLRIVIPGAAELGVQFEGSFIMANASVEAGLDDAVSLTASFQSSGAVETEAVAA